MESHPIESAPIATPEEAFEAVKPKKIEPAKVASAEEANSLVRQYASLSPRERVMLTDNMAAVDAGLITAPTAIRRELELARQNQEAAAAKGIDEYSGARAAMRRRDSETKSWIPHVEPAQVASAKEVNEALGQSEAQDEVLKNDTPQEASNHYRPNAKVRGSMVVEGEAPPAMDASASGEEVGAAVEQGSGEVPPIKSLFNRKADEGLGKEPSQTVQEQSENTDEEWNFLEAALLKMGRPSFMGKSEQAFRAEKKPRRLMKVAATVIGFTAAGVLSYRYFGGEQLPDISSIPVPSGTSEVAKAVVESTPEAIEATESIPSDTAEQAIDDTLNLSDLIDQVKIVLPETEAVAVDDGGMAEMVTSVAEQADEAQVLDSSDLAPSIGAVSQEAETAASMGSGVAEMANDVVEHIESAPADIPVEIGEAATQAYEVAPGQGFINILENNEGLTKAEAIQLITEHREELLNLEAFRFDGGDYHDIRITAPGGLDLADTYSDFRSSIDAIKAARH